MGNPPHPRRRPPDLGPAVMVSAPPGHPIGAPVSTRAGGATVLIMVTARATFSAGPVHLSLSAREGPVAGTWRYNLTHGPDHRAAGGRITGMTDHLDVLRYAAAICSAGYQPGTAERSLLEQFAAGHARAQGQAPRCPKLRRTQLEL